MSTLIPDPDQERRPAPTVDYDAAEGSLGVLVTPGAPKSSGHGATPAEPAGGATPAGAIGITLGDMWIKSTAPSTKAGKVTFAVANEGATMHGLGIVKAPATLSGGSLDESTLLAKGAQLDGGQGETVSADLEPGSYELVCYLAGHFAAGQKMPFTVE